MGEKVQLKTRHGIVTLFIVMVAFVLIAKPLQEAWGLYGLAATELMILMFGLIPALIYKVNLKEMLPVRKPRFYELTGSLMVWLGTYVLVIVINLFTVFLFPESMGEISEYMGDYFTSVPLLAAIFIVAVLPAVCEEVLHRGFILQTIGVKNKWGRIFMMAFLFGLFHLDPYRFLTTAILGGAMTYVMVETNNFLLPVLMHFVNNALTTLIAFNTQGQSAIGAEEIPMLMDILVVSLIALVIVPLIFLIAWKLLHPKVTHRKPKKRRIIIGLGVALVMFLVGSAIVEFYNSHDNGQRIFETRTTMSVNANTPDMEVPFTIEQSREHVINLKLDNQRGISVFKIVDLNGKVFLETSANKLTMDSIIYLQKGDYNLVIAFLVTKEDIEEYSRQQLTETTLNDLNVTEESLEFSKFELDVVLR